MIQIFPTIIFGLYTRLCSGTALLAGWAVGMLVGSSLAWGEKPWTAVHGLKRDILLLGTIDTGLSISVYNGLTSVLANVVVAIVLSFVIRSTASEETVAADYENRMIA